MHSFRLIITHVAVYLYLTVEKSDQIVKVDPDHLRKYPNCGVIGPPLGRMSNLKEAVIHYPWVVKIVQKNRRIDPLEEWAESNTQGAIITERCKNILHSRALIG